MPNIQINSLHYAHEFFTKIATIFLCCLALNLILILFINYEFRYALSGLAAVISIVLAALSSRSAHKFFDRFLVCASLLCSIVFFVWPLMISSAA